MQFLYKYNRTTRLGLSLTMVCILFGYCNLSVASITQTCSKWKLLKPACQRLKQIIYTGSDELYFSGYAWHNRFTYNPERVRTYNEQAWGGGYGKGLYDEDGDWHGLYGIAFLDSHKNVEPAIGYAFSKVAHFNKDTGVGIGYTVLVTMRPDINHGYPFPGILPWATLTHKRLSLAATYIPGVRDAGNVLYILGKFTL